MDFAWGVWCARVKVLMMRFSRFLASVRFQSGTATHRGCLLMPANHRCEIVLGQKSFAFYFPGRSRAKPISSSKIDCRHRSCPCTVRETPASQIAYLRFPAPAPDLSPELLPGASKTGTRGDAVPPAQGCSFGDRFTHTEALKINFFRSLELRGG